MQFSNECIASLSFPGSSIRATKRRYEKKIVVLMLNSNLIQKHKSNKRVISNVV